MAFNFVIAGNFKEEAIVNSASLKRKGFKMKTKANIKAGQVPPTWVTNY